MPTVAVEAEAMAACDLRGTSRMQQQHTTHGEMGLQHSAADDVALVGPLHGSSAGGTYSPEHAGMHIAWAACSQCAITLDAGPQAETVIEGLPCLSPCVQT